MQSWIVRKGLGDLFAGITKNVIIRGYLRGFSQSLILMRKMEINDTLSETSFNLYAVGENQTRFISGSLFDFHLH